MWRLQTSKPEKSKDFGAFDANTNAGRQVIEEFDKAVNEKATELSAEYELPTVEQQYTNLCSAISHATQTTLPDRQKGKRIQRVVSKRTRNLFKERTKMGKSSTKRTKAEYDELQKRIKESSLKDHEELVGTCLCGGDGGRQ